MITNYFINGSKVSSINHLNVEDINTIGLQFDSIESRDSFISHLPKKLKLKGSFIDSIYGKFPFINIYCEKENRRTGDVNELGRQRIEEVFNYLIK